MAKKPLDEKPAPLGLDPAADAGPPPQAAEPERGRQSAAPTCPYCGRPCKARHSSRVLTYYYCDTESGGCGLYSAKQPRPGLPTRRHEEPEDFSAR